VYFPKLIRIQSRRKDMADRIKLPTDPNKDANGKRRYQGREGSNVCVANTCICCGRKAGAYWIAVDLGTNEVVSVEEARRLDESEIDPPQWFPIGNTCRKIIPTTHRLSRKKFLGA